MASRQGVQKQQAWEERLGRYRESGLTVARFCERERVSVHSFYYWAKRVRSASVGKSSLRAGSNASAQCRRCVKHTSAASGISNAGVVRFSWNAAVEVSVPAGCLDAIRCLVECLQQARAERCGAFQEVVVKS